MTASRPVSPRSRAPDWAVIVRTKLRPPVVHEGMIRRPRLEAALDAATRARLCLVSAPAGFGKTALVSAWATAETAGRRVAWVSLDAGDNDPFRFWTYVSEALCRVDPGLARSLRRLKAAAS